VTTTAAGYTVRPATGDDAGFLGEMLLEAVNWNPDRPAMSMTQLRADPTLWKYVADWPAEGERGVVAEVQEVPGTQPVGAAWWRYFSAESPGYGFVAPDIPELSVALVPSWRGRGVGRALLRAVLAEARSAGLDKISLSVEPDNHAAALYASEGFEVVGGDENSDTMVKRLAEGTGRHAARRTTDT
jgi:GNAT superfamily N-acetyltransferase